MVAIIKTGNSIRATFFYNENKAKEGAADCIMAQNYPMDLETMTENHKLKMLLKTAAANENVGRNSVHISLNFAAEDNLFKERLQQIAAEYMEGIGFGKQPYLVYKHHDAGHRHIQSFRSKYGLTEAGLTRRTSAKTRAKKRVRPSN